MTAPAGVDQAGAELEDTATQDPDVARILAEMPDADADMGGLTGRERQVMHLDAMVHDPTYSREKRQEALARLKAYQAGQRPLDDVIHALGHTLPWERDDWEDKMKAARRIR